MADQDGGLVSSGTALSVGVTEGKGVSLCEVLDRVLDTGVVAHGDVVFSVADIDLVFLSLRLLLTSVETARKNGMSVPTMPGSRRAAADVSGTPPPPAERLPAPSPPHGIAAPPGAPVPAALVRAAPVPSAVEVLPAEKAERETATRLNVPADDVKNGLAQLVMVLVKLLHELMERQAVKRIDGGALTDEEIERLGTTLMRQAEEIRRLQKTLGLTDDDMNLDLGPLGKLI